MEAQTGAYVTPNVRLERPLGRGGMGAVWVAWHETLGTEVVVKFLSPELAGNDAMRARFAREASAAARVKSAHVVQIHDYGVTDTGTPYIVMERLEGTDLARYLAARGKLDPVEAVGIVGQLCRALDRAHESGVVHRDIKPENVFLTREGDEPFVKLLDFGIAKSEPVAKLEDSKRSTTAGEVLGTPYYMSPEQVKDAKAIDYRSDLWSVGVLSYELLTGELPFRGDSMGALAIAINECAAVAPSSRDPSLPAAFDVWFARACAHAPKQRFHSARDLAEALRAAFGMATAPRASFPEIAAGHGADSGRIVVHAGGAETGLRDTASAMSSDSQRRAAKSRRWAVLVGGVALLAGAVVLVAALARRDGSSAAPAPAKGLQVDAVPSQPRSGSALTPPLPGFAAASLDAGGESMPAHSASAGPASATPLPRPRGASLPAVPPARSAGGVPPRGGDIW